MSQKRQEVEPLLPLLCVLSNGDIINDLDGTITRFSMSRHF